MQAKDIQFGSGVVYGAPNAGDLAANPTPQQLGTVQSCSIDFKGDLKELYGRNQHAVATARGKVSVTGKATFATIDPNVLNQLCFGQSKTTGMVRMAVEESAPVGATPYHIVASHGANFEADFGVMYAASRIPLEKVAAAPAVGQYTVDIATGTYTFAAADTGVLMLVSYTWTDTANGKTITINNKPMGYAPAFRMYLFNEFDSNSFGVDLASVRVENWSLPTKQEDFWMIDFAFKASADASGLLAKIYAD